MGFFDRFKKSKSKKAEDPIKDQAEQQPQPVVDAEKLEPAAPPIDPDPVETEPTESQSTDTVSAEPEPHDDGKVADEPQESLAEMINLIEEGTISNNVAKELFPEMFSTGKSARDLVREKGLEMKSDGDEIEIICKQSISENPDAADKFRGGKEGAINALKGAVMKATRGQANPKLVDEILRRLLS